MLNEDKIRLMTGIAMLEKKEGRRLWAINKYFKSDYISVHLMKSFFTYSCSFLLGAGVWALYSIEGLLEMTDLEQLTSLGVRAGVIYAAGLVCYLLITAAVYAKRYDKAVIDTKHYLAQLKRLNKRYEFQNKSRELAKEGGRHDGASRI